MKMIPSQAHETGSTAELKVFQKFSAIASMGQDAVCFHSLTIANHVIQRFGEADFVVICRSGLFVFEVKGGIVSRDGNGTWHFIDRWGNDNTSKRGPFVQAQEALHSISAVVEKGIDKGVFDKICIGFGVLMPDSSFDVTGAEWDEQTVLTADGFNFFDRWLKQFTAYWFSRDNRPDKSILSADEIQKIKECLRPEFAPKASLNGQLEIIHARMIRATKDQFRLLDVVQANPRAICIGGAGTGKKELAFELCMRIGETNNKTLLVCKSLWLSRYLMAKSMNRHVSFSTIAQLSGTADNTKNMLYDSLIVVEGHEIITAQENMELLGKLLKGGFLKGRWRLFADKNYLEGLPISENLDFNGYADLLRLNPVKIPLKRNCRNTAGIIQHIQRNTGYDTGETGSGYGPDVKVLKCDNGPEYLLAEELKRLTSIESVPLREITILSPVGFKKSCACRLNAYSRSNIHVLDEHSVEKIHMDNKISYAPIENFKNLENKCLILIDICCCDFKNRPELLYLGMSRATASLSVIISRTAR
jgi:hypothetical protein